MKISIVTIIDNQNIGTFLQAYALSKVVKKYGHDVKVLNYRRKRTEFIPFIKQIWNEKKSNPISAFISIFYRVLVVGISRRKLLGFLKKHITISRKYNSYDLYQGAEQDADIYIVGSDQVWNSTYNNGIDGIFYLDFVPPHTVKIAYAASIGKDRFSVDESERVRELLLSFRALSVRESIAVEALQSIGIDNGTHVLDPTMLIKKDEWIEIAKQDSFKKTEPYLLVYSVEVVNRSFVEKQAKEIASRQGLKIYVVTTDWVRGKMNCDKIFYFASPTRFLSLFYNADFVIASSFHGTVFSLIFEKEFLSVSPQKYNSRIESLLNLLDVQHRIIYNNLPLNENLKKIDYNKVNKCIGTLRTHSLSFLDKVLVNN